MDIGALSTSEVWPCSVFIAVTSWNDTELRYFLIADDVPYIWTSGRLCDFKGCENRKDLEPKNVFGWFWSANRDKLSPTNQVRIEFLYFQYFNNYQNVNI